MMTKERMLQVIKEATFRLWLWLENTTFDDMTCHYSYLRFTMAIGLGGYCFEKEIWMKDEFTEFLTDEEFWDVEYDMIMSKLFHECCEDINWVKKELDKQYKNN